MSNPTSASLTWTEYKDPVRCFNSENLPNGWYGQVIDLRLICTDPKVHETPYCSAATCRYGRIGLPGFFSDIDTAKSAAIEFVETLRKVDAWEDFFLACDSKIGIGCDFLINNHGEMVPMELRTQ